MGNFNPSDPCTVGCEWFPTRETSTRLKGPFVVAAASLVASTTDNVAAVWVPIASSGGTGVFLVECYDLTATPMPDSLAELSTAQYRPSEDYASVNAYGFGTFAPSGTATGVYRACDETSLVPTFFTPTSNIPVASDFVYPILGLGAEYAAKVGGIAGATAGRVITRLTVWACVNVYADLQPTEVVAKFRPYLVAGGTRVVGDTFTAPEPSAGGYLMRFDLYVNPSTGLPWTPDDVDGFDDGAAVDSAIGILIDPSGSANVLAAVHQLWLEVESCAGPDPRLAVGRLAIPNEAFPAIRQGWLDVPLVDPTDGTDTSFNLAVGREYLFTLRLVTGDAWCDWRKLDADVDLPGPPDWVSYRPSIQRQTRRLSALNDAETAAHGIGLQDIFTGFSEDSQPYLSINGDISDELGLNYPWTRIHDALGPFQQEVTPTGNMTADWFRVLVRLEQADSNGRLYVRVRRRSDDVQVGSTIIIAPEDLAEPRDRWQVAEVRLGSAAALVSGTQYYFDVASDATLLECWHVQVLSSSVGDVPAGLDNFAPGSIWVAGFGGVTDRLYVDGQEWSALDAAITIAESPAAPADFTAVGVDDTCCVPYVALLWTATAISECGLVFDRYEVDRSTDGGTTWQRITEVSDESVADFDDHEFPFGAEVSYRLRVRRSDNAVSEWVTADVTAPSNCEGLAFTSNAAPELGVHYPDVSLGGDVPDRVYEVIDNREIYEPMGRDGAIEIRELEDRLVQFTRTLLVRSGADGCPDSSACVDWALCGHDVFNPLRDIARAGVPYVAVRNECGEVFYATLRVNTTRWHKGSRSGTYTADVFVRALTTVPWPVDSGSAGS